MMRDKAQNFAELGTNTGATSWTNQSALQIVAFDPLAAIRAMKGHAAWAWMTVKAYLLLRVGFVILPARKGFSCFRVP